MGRLARADLRAARARPAPARSCDGDFDVVPRGVPEPVHRRVRPRGRSGARCRSSRPCTTSCRTTRACPRRSSAGCSRAQYRNAGTLLVHHEAVGRRLVARVRPRSGPGRRRPAPDPGDRAATERRRRRSGPPTVLFFGTFRRNKGIDRAARRDRAAAGRDRRPLRVRRPRLPRRRAAGARRRGARPAHRDRDRLRDRGPEERAARHRRSRWCCPYTSFASQSAVLQDAYAHRLPVVVTDVGALGETVRGDGTGWVVPPADAGAARARRSSPRSATRPACGAASAAADAIARDRTPVLTGRRYRALYERAAGTLTRALRRPGSVSPQRDARARQQVRVHEPELGELLGPDPPRRPRRCPP